MSDHALLCIDRPRAGEADRAVELAGWCLATRPVQALAAELPDGTRYPAQYGAIRHDVAVSHAGYPNGERCGFSIELPAGRLDGLAAISLALTLGKRRPARCLRLELPLDSNDTRRYVLHRADRRRHLPETLEQKLRGSLEKRPGITLRLDIVNKCNLRCVMCHYSDDSVFRRPARSLTPTEFRRLFAGVAPLVRSVVLSCADEPLVSPHFADIVSYLADEYPLVDIELCTNATLLNGRIRHLLVEKGVAHLILSIDGVRKATLESIRVGARYERVLANILALRDLERAVGTRRPAFVLDFVMMDRNLHEAPAFVEMAARLGAALIDFRHVIPSRFFDDPGQLLARHPAKYNYFRERVLEASRRFGVDVVLPPPFATREYYQAEDLPPVDLADFEAVTPDSARDPLPMPRRHPHGFRPRHRRGTAGELFADTYCERPFSEIMVSEQEQVKPCPWHRVPLARLGDGATLGEIFYGPEFARLRRNMLRPEGDPNCQGCPMKAQYLMSETAQFASAGARTARLKQWLRQLRAGD